MNYLIQNSPYPVHVLPAMLRDFADRVVAATQSSYEMVVPVMLAGMSAAVQGVADVKTPYGEIMPTSLFSFVIAKSGDRKSSILKKVMKGFEDFERGKISEHVFPGWENQELIHHQFLIEDATSKGVIDIFKEGASSLFYALDEAALIFNKLDMPYFCKRFDGSAINEVSRTQGTTRLLDRRVALCMLTQDVTFERFFSKKGDVLVESGLMPRMLISQASAHTGIYRWNPLPANEENLERHGFHQRVRELMKKYAKELENTEISREVVCFDKSACELWEQYIKNVDFVLNHHGEWEEIRAFMRRSGELVMRIAAVLQYFTEPGDKIQPWAVQSSIEMVRWHLHEAKRIFGEESLELRIKKDVDLLFKYTIGRYQRTGSKYIEKGELLRYGPKSLRKSDVLDIAIRNLFVMGKLQISKYGRKEIVVINDNYAQGVGEFFNGVLNANW
ncbi:DUF3987 domain-containing protein [Achromobacter ruhlandii]|uniref:DUF3987 domain-containing protein n=1 Tax=Achromobacter ruhlandii TaxID=72557 RepID=A0ABM8LXQ8_9BURK|nr:DUF3987 domain-containing protein [Achromobacter ruhlandii]MCZ8431359.1 DUF3987 domain-containing protein [Achromobacter ruhlandii]MDC6091203.1 DUF3987 domain-containing protein [Achromobacter ruhlandii]MDC6154141.1 DUF3987 domain-containing protein [Achromobacter ruhlandii]MDD7979761.1 DUF3987 domain-containing protein [Achromobacter ruhlandii]WIW02294.1 DUF3987 domain-containing protein [Achromobacter ruhlandii]